MTETRNLRYLVCARRDGMMVLMRETGSLLEAEFVRRRAEEMSGTTVVINELHEPPQGAVAAPIVGA